MSDEIPGDPLLKREGLLVPAGAVLAMTSFFLPWVSSGENGHELSDVNWIVFIMAGLIYISSICWRRPDTFRKLKLMVIALSLFALAAVVITHMDFANARLHGHGGLSPGNSGVRLRFGIGGTALGFVLSSLGVLLREIHPRTSSTSGSADDASRPATPRASVGRPLTPDAFAFVRKGRSARSRAARLRTLLLASLPIVLVLLCPAIKLCGHLKEAERERLILARRRLWFALYPNKSWPVDEELVAKTPDPKLYRDVYREVDRVWSAGKDIDPELRQRLLDRLSEPAGTTTPTEKP